MNDSEFIVELESAKKHYPIKNGFKKKNTIKALDGVSFKLKKGKTLAIIGESGCGKSTLAKYLMQVETATSGEYKIDGQLVSNLEMKDFYSQIQMIFQDPYSSINPRKKAWQIISEPLMVNTNLSKEECRSKAIEMMEVVGLRGELANRYPHMFSGGQRQRIGIARALILMPKILICDEPVSALDVSIQAQVINLLIDLQDKFDITYIFISHDLSVVSHLADEILVMYLGKVVEYGNAKEIIENPKHPYTMALLAATPSISPGAHKFKPIEGELPSPLNPPSGCAFHERCQLRTDQCLVYSPTPKLVSNRLVSCLEVL
ncbi:MAG: dipeptide ABC transporter ATP-binding protein [Halobacteriovoraceae bacterium]|nr:dipeptide ABC transporter ATP-binding protein [Halobacteriovoraceae bacterium]